MRDRDRLHEECGVFGIFGAEESTRLTYLGLYAQQHRGQESAGIVSSDGGRFSWHKGIGLVADVFTEDILDSLYGNRAIGHCRYSTAGSSVLANAQPLCRHYHGGQVAVAHNGNIVNGVRLRNAMGRQGAVFSSTSDTEVVLHLLAQARQGSFEEDLVHACRQVYGAFSMVLLTPNALYAVRDRFGFRPLCMGRLDGAWAFASETSALDIIDGEYLRDVTPGEIIKIDESGLESIPFAHSDTRAHCVFEHVYFAVPQSMIFGEEAYQKRKRMGELLARNHGADADIVIPVPDSSNVAALGFSQESGIPFEMGIIRNHYIGRTFIEPSQRIRDFGSRIKYGPVRGVLKGKRVVVVDDSIVRGTTMRKLIRRIYQAGAKEVHLRISSPVITHPCCYGTDTSTRDELIGSSHSVEEIRHRLGSTTLEYLTVEELFEAVGGTRDTFCVACFSGEYPRLPDEIGKFAIEGVAFESEGNGVERSG